LSHRSWPIAAQLARFAVFVTVCLCVGHTGQSCKNCWTNCDAVGGADLLEPRELCIRWECILAPSGEYDWMICVVWHYVTLLWPLVDCCEFGCWYSAFDCFRTLISEMICCVVYRVGRWPLLTRSFTHFSLLLCIFASSLLMGNKFLYVYVGVIMIQALQFELSGLIGFIVISAGTLVRCWWHLLSCVCIIYLNCISVSVHRWDRNEMWCV